MKFRSSFVTNSSSSSFVISAKDIGLDQLFNGAFREFYFNRNDYYPTLSQVLNNDDINCALFVKTGKEINDDSYDETNFLEDELFYVIDNNCICRFDWETVREIFEEKHKINYTLGYCD